MREILANCAEALRRTWNSRFFNWGGRREVSAVPGGTAALPPVFSAGTLRYSRLGLSLLFFWLLWGHFTYLLMEAVIPGLLPLLLKQHSASNAEISFITSSLNVIGNMFFNPVVSFISDRHRGPMGRRRPFILYTTPLVVLCLGLIPFGPDISAFVMKVPVVGQLMASSPVLPAIFFIAVFVMGFQVFDVFVGSVYHYLVRDTVPEAFLGRFSGLFRLVGGLAPLVWNLAVFRHGETHMKEVFVGVAVFYGLGMLLMCWKVKEGEYPAPEPLNAEPGRTHWAGRLWKSARAYIRDCFRDPLYWSCFLGCGLATWATLSGVFAVLFYREELKISLAVQGNVNAVNSALTLLIAVPIGILIDRWNYFRLAQTGAFFQGLACILGFLLIRDVPTLMVFGICYTIPKLVFVMGMSRAVIAVYPKEKYGQFGSAGAAFGSLGAIGMSILAAKFVDGCGSYRSYLLWQGVCLMLAAMVFLVVERRWLRLGGWANYRAP